MKVVLRRPVEGLGNPGDVKEVSDGYARNFLIPKGLAQLATAAQLKVITDQKVSKMQSLSRQERENRALAERVAQTHLTFKAKVGEQHRLYGSVTSHDIAERLSEALGQPIDKRKVELKEPIRHLGTYQVPVRVAHDLTPEVVIAVESE
ncbi:MAG: 50S ribosomal protein L9 [Chloroflexi bacterium]|nr:50S ribosomal protein L9 [Chloroflexota bacterium]